MFFKKIFHLSKEEEASSLFKTLASLNYNINDPSIQRAVFSKFNLTDILTTEEKENIVKNALKPIKTRSFRLFDFHKKED